MASAEEVDEVPMLGQRVGDLSLAHHRVKLSLSLNLTLIQRLYRVLLALASHERDRSEGALPQFIFLLKLFDFIVLHLTCNLVVFLL